MSYVCAFARVRYWDISQALHSALLKTKMLSLNGSQVEASKQIRTTALTIQVSAFGNDRQRTRSVQDGTRAFLPSYGRSPVCGSTGSPGITTGPLQTRHAVNSGFGIQKNPKMIMLSRKTNGCGEPIILGNPHKCSSEPYQQTAQKAWNMLVSWSKV